MTRRDLMAGLAWFSLVVAGPAAGAGPGMANHHPVLSPDEQRVLFDSDHEGDSEIYVMDVDGSNLTRLTHDPGSDTGMKWSDDGSSIFFRRSSGPGIYPDLHRMDADGSNVEKVEADAAFHWVWSEDRSMILDGPVGDERPPHGIFVMNADGTGRRPLTTFVEASVNSNMHFSPDGSRVVYESFVGNASTGEIYVVGIDGSGRRKLTTGTDPYWSPDGSLIVFKALDDAGRWVIHVIAPDGSHDRAFHPGSHPTWFSDSRRILYMGAADRETQIFVMNIADGSRIQITR